MYGKGSVGLLEAKLMASQEEKLETAKARLSSDLGIIVGPAACTA